MKLVRKSVSRSKSAKSFRHGAAKTKVLNVRAAPQRGGWRL